MTILNEGDLCFTFAPGVLVMKYDDWSFYRNQFVNGCATDNKAVDFVCVVDKTVWLIEVKDYRSHCRSKAGELADEIACKVRDSLAGLAVAQTMANDKQERSLARSAMRAQCLRVVCHVEQPKKSSRLRPVAIEPDKLGDQLRRRLKAVDPHPRVMAAGAGWAGVPWRVTVVA